MFLMFLSIIHKPNPKVHPQTIDFFKKSAKLLGYEHGKRKI